MTEPDPLADRLRHLGRQPVDPATSSRHLTAMAAAGTGRRRLPTKLKVGLAFGAGLLLGGTGLASAGALPAPAQDVARTTLAKVGVNVPHGTERFNDPAVCGLDPATQKPFRNHGQYVKANRDDAAAAQSRCGKPRQAGTGTDEEPAGTPADPAQGKGKGKANGKGNGGNKNGDKSGKPDKADEKETADEPAPAAPAAPASTAKPPRTPGGPKPTTTTLAPATTTTMATTTTTTAG